MLKHILNMLVNDRELCLWVTSQLLKMWSMLTRVNAMRNDAGTAYVVLGPRKDTRAGADECLCTVTLRIGQVRRKTTQQTVEMIVHSRRR